MNLPGSWEQETKSTAVHKGSFDLKIEAKIREEWFPRRENEEAGKPSHSPRDATSVGQSIVFPPVTGHVSFDSNQTINAKLKKVLNGYLEGFHAKHRAYLEESREQLPLDERQLDPKKTSTKFVEAPQIGCRLEIPETWESRNRRGVLELIAEGIQIDISRLHKTPESQSHWLRECIAREKDKKNQRLEAWSTQESTQGSQYSFVTICKQPARHTRWTKEPTEKRLICLYTKDYPFFIEGIFSSCTQEAFLSILLPLLATSQPLPPEARQLWPEESWLPIPLRGPWEAQEKGTYLLDGQETVLLQARKASADVPVEDLYSSARNSFSQNQLAFKERLSSRDHRGGKLHLQDIDTIGKSGQRGYFRGTYFFHSESSYDSQLFSGDESHADSLAKQIRDRIRTPRRD